MSELENMNQFDIRLWLFAKELALARAAVLKNSLGLTKLDTASSSPASGSVYIFCFCVYLLCISSSGSV